MNILVDQYLTQLNEADPVSTAHKEYMFKVKQQCKKFKGLEKRKCIIQGKVAAKKAQLSKMKQMSGECRKAQNPNACQRVLFKKAQKIRNSTDSLMQQYRDISVKLQKQQTKQNMKGDYGEN